MKHTEILSDSFLLEELRNRLKEKNKLLQNQAAMVAELEDLNDKLRETERVKSGFLSNIRNEINNPLTSVLGLSQQLMSGKVTDQERIARIAGLINKEVFSLDFQLRNIFSAAEIEAGEITPEPAIVEVDTLVQSQVDYFFTKAAQHKVSFSVHDTGNKRFKTDGKMLQNMVMNLLANAIEFSPAGGTVHIACEIKDDKLTISVKDSGPGIPDEDQKRLFSRFKQLQSGTTKEHSGHGLGLSIVKEFADALHGEIKLVSQPGQGVTATVMVPEFELSRLPEGLSLDGQEILFGDEEIF